MIIRNLDTHQIHVDNSTAACQQCGLGCGLVSVSKPTASTAQAQQFAVSTWGLHLVVLVLYGLPLLALCAMVVVLQSWGLWRAPLLSFSLICGALGVTAWLISSKGTQLLHLLQARVGRFGHSDLGI